VNLLETKVDRTRRKEKMKTKEDNGNKTNKDTYGKWKNHELNVDKQGSMEKQS
jgi:hypothetical protein